MPCDTSYLFECGVLHRLSLLRSFHNLQLDRRNNLTLSFCTNPSFEVGGISTGIVNLKDFLSLLYSSQRGDIFEFECAGKSYHPILMAARMSEAFIDSSPLSAAALSPASP